MFNHRNSIIGFGFIIVLQVSLAGVALYHLNTIATGVDNIYRHPFAVSNAGKNIEINILAIQRDMKEAMLVEDQRQVEKFLRSIDRREQAVLAEFEVIFDRFLGDKQHISETYRLFLDWRSIRNEVFALYSVGERQQAVAIIRQSGIDHVQQLLDRVHEFVLFAETKADEFHRQTQLERDNSIFIVSLISLLTFLASLAVAVVVVRTNALNDRRLARQDHLIDQNIMMARLDADGVITEISNALCRFLHTTPKDIIGAMSHFFDNSEQRDEINRQIWSTIKTGQRWHGETCFVSQAGTSHWAEMTILPEFDDHYAITGYSCLLQDTTGRKLSFIDSLTGLPNRRDFDETLGRELKIARRQADMLTLSIIDVDHFKRYNDRYGHPQGDEALKKVADCLQASLQRPNDYVFRIGGEEFALIHSGLDLEQSRHFLDSVRAAVEKLQEPHDDNPASPFLTISVGACVIPGAACADRSMIYGEADKALYQAKKQRNRVVVRSEPETGGQRLAEMV